MAISSIFAPCHIAINLRDRLSGDASLNVGKSRNQMRTVGFVKLPIIAVTISISCASLFAQSMPPRYVPEAVGIVRFEQPALLWSLKAGATNVVDLTELLAKSLAKRKPGSIADDRISGAAPAKKAATKNSTRRRA